MKNTKKYFPITPCKTVARHLIDQKQNIILKT